MSSAPLQIILFDLLLMLHELSAIFLQYFFVLLEQLSKLYLSLPAAFLQLQQEIVPVEKSSDSDIWSSDANVVRCISCLCSIGQFGLT